MTDTSRSSIVLASVLRLLQPAVGLLLRHGVGYPAFAAALKEVFVRAAEEELQRTGQKRTASAVSLLSGVHRRDVRELPARVAQKTAKRAPMNMASEVVARWLSQPDYLDEEGQPLPLPRMADDAKPSFDALVASISSDIRPRAVLNELERLGLVFVDADVVHLLEAGFVPRQGFAEMAALLQDNVHDHLAAAARNIEGDGNFLEQAIFVDELSAESVEHLHKTAARAWRQAFKTVMREAQTRYDYDQAHTPAKARTERARFGAYFYAADQSDASNNHDEND